ncbi:hypothetical protein [Candidatus Epulonipiscium viviparus]|uniref:hypothetical protein n=1 Tax=Candidatus Epulonipiscium viviparus TaxID=420336 RepID=UPI0027380FF8|nr:hypothetical protein [Candidatus Epulopiscium viviparus]
MKLTLVTTLLLAGIMMVPTSASEIQTISVKNEIAHAKVYMYNDGLFLRLLDTDRLYGAEITITFADDLDDATTQFQYLPSTTLNFANVSGNEMKILIEDSNPITYADELDVAFVRYPTDTIIESIHVKMIYPNETKNFWVYSTVFTNEIYHMPPAPERSVLPTPEVAPNVSYVGPNQYYYPTPEVGPSPNPNYTIPTVGPNQYYYPTPEVGPRWDMWDQTQIILYQQWVRTNITTQRQK